MFSLCVGAFERLVGDSFLREIFENIFNSLKKYLKYHYCIRILFYWTIILKKYFLDVFYLPAYRAYDREHRRDVIETRRKKSVFALKKRQLSLNEPKFKVAFIFSFIFYPRKA